jgi:hypothetical protein
VAASTAATKGFSVPGGAKRYGVAIRGKGKPPLVEVRGPGGFSAKTVSSRGVINSSRYTLVRSVPDATTYLFLKSPKAGSYRVRTLTGSAALKGLAFARELPAPNVKARVITKSCKRTLAWSFAKAKGRKVTFVEQGARTIAKIVTSAKSPGKTAFRPAPGPAGPRKILAYVEQDGFRRAPVQVASVRVQDGLRPPAPKKLSAKLEGKRLTASWTPVCSAARYRVKAVRATTNKTIETTKSKATLELPGKGRASVTVTSLNNLGEPGKSRTGKTP